MRTLGKRVKGLYPFRGFESLPLRRFIKFNLYMDNRPIVSLAQAKSISKKHGVPIYIYKKGIIKRQYELLDSAIKYPNKTIYYSCKANSNPEVLRYLKRLGSSIETVSPGEIEKALKAGFRPDDVSFSCSSISKEELISVAKKRVIVHLDSLKQLEWWGEEKLGREVSLRINAGFGAGNHEHVITGGPDSKFGIYVSDISRAKKIAHNHNLVINGLQQHIGSNILDEKIFMKGAKLISGIAKEFPEAVRIDVGGGLGIPYKSSQKPLDVKKMGSALTKLFRELSRSFGKQIEMSLEPGRYLVAEAGGLLVKVVDIKRTPGHLFVGVNSGFNHMVRHAMYGSYNHVYNLSRPEAPRRRALVVGDICESADVLAEQSIPMPEIGDLLLFADIGAYGYSMASDYNSRPKPVEVVIP